MTTTPDITRDFVAVRTKYHPEYVAEIKTLPRDRRFWNPDSKEWLVHRKSLPFVRRLASKLNLAIQERELADIEDPEVEIDLDNVSGIPLSLAFRMLELKGVMTDADQSS